MASKRPYVASRPTFSSGAIERLELVNFMTHANLTLTFNPKINILTGVNGSGKSSVLQAIILALGGSAKSTKRGTTQCSEFIQHGEQKSVITLILHNGGNWPFKADVYGRSLCLVRTLYRHRGTETCVKSLDGRNSVTGSQAVEERKLIVDHFCIDAHNPINVLHQEEAKVIFTNADAKLLFQMFYSGSRLKECRRVYDLQEQRNAELEKVLEKKRQNWDHLQEERDRLKVELNMTGEVITSVREDIRHKMYSSSVAALAKQKNICKGLQRSIEKTQLREQEILDDLRVLEQLKVNAEGRRADKRGDLARAQTNYEIGLAEFSQCAQKAEVIHEKIRALDHEIKHITWKLRDLKNQSRTNFLNANLPKSPTKNDARIEGIKEKINRLTSEKVALELVVRAEQKEKSDLEIRRTKAIESTQEAEAGLKRLKESPEMTGKCLEIYGQNFVQLSKKISEHAKSFLRAPLGPVGLHIQLALESSDEQKLSKLIEAALSRKFLQMFVVESMNDLNSLKSLMNMCGLNVPIAIMDMNGDRYDIQKSKSQAESVLMDYLHVDNDTVFNLLVDLIEPQTLAIMDFETALTMWEKGKLCPGNTTKIISTNGFIFNPPPDTFACLFLPEFSDTKSRLLNVINCKSEINSLEEIVEAGRKSLQEIEAQLIEKERILSSSQEKLDGLSRSIVTTKETLWRHEQADNDLKFREENLSRLQGTIHDQRGEHRSKLQDLHAERSAINKLYRDAEMNVAKLKKLCEEAIADIPDDVDDINAKIKVAQQDLSFVRTTLAKAEEDLNQANAIFKEKEVSLKKVAPDVPPEENSSDLLFNPTSILAEHINAMFGVANERKSENEKATKKLHENLREVVIRLSVLEGEIRNLEETLAIFKRIVQKRKDTLLAIRHPMARMIQGGFEMNLSNYQMFGNIALDWDNELLVIKVNPDGQRCPGRQFDDANEAVSKELMALSSLSGGERTVALICFLGSLWYNTLSPFRCLDEWDVFLDNATREKSEQQLVEIAQSCGDQCIFISPGSSLFKSGDDPEITVFEIKKS